MSEEWRPSSFSCKQCPNDNLFRSEDPRLCDFDRNIWVVFSPVMPREDNSHLRNGFIQFFSRYEAWMYSDGEPRLCLLWWCCYFTSMTIWPLHCLANPASYHDIQVECDKIILLEISEAGEQQNYIQLFQQQTEINSIYRKGIRKYDEPRESEIFRQRVLPMSKKKIWQHYFDSSSQRHVAVKI